MTKAMRYQLITPIDITGLTYQELKKLDNTRINSFIVVTGDKDSWYLGSYSITLKFKGRKHYPEIQKRGVTYKNRKWYGTDPKDFETDVLYLFKYFNIDWASNLYDKSGSMVRYIIRSKSILYRIINGSITSDEGFYKAVAKYYFRIKMSWKVLRDYFKANIGIGIPSLYDIKDFTTNCELFIEEFISSDDNKRAIMRDVLGMAIIEDSLVNPKWSYKRLTQEHAKQIMRANRFEAEKLSDESIYSHEALEELNMLGINVLNSERNTFFKAQDFGNCVYRCYWNAISKYDYIAFICEIEGHDVMVGVKTNDNDLVIDQAFMRYNAVLSDSQRSEVDALFEVIKPKLRTLHDDFLFNKEDVTAFNWHLL